jgi:hypothetical protein
VRRDLVALDFEQLQRHGFVERDGVPAHEARRWRHALAGLAHGQGQRVTTGRCGPITWAALADEPLDLGDRDPGRAMRP